MTTDSNAAYDWRLVAPLDLGPILSAATEVFYERGFHGASIREIATRAEVALPTLYYHHGSKEGLLLDLLMHSSDDLLRRVTAATASAGEEPTRQLSNVAEAVVLTITHRASLAVLEGEIRYLSADNRRDYRRARKIIEQTVAEIVRAGNETGEFRSVDVQETTRAVLAMFQSIPRWFRSDGLLTPEAAAEQYVQIILKTVGHVGST